MSRIAKAPITIPEGVNITQAEGLISVKGKLGEMTMHVNSAVLVSNNENILTFEPNEVNSCSINNRFWVITVYMKYWGIYHFCNI